MRFTLVRTFIEPTSKSLLPSGQGNHQISSRPHFGKSDRHEKCAGFNENTLSNLEKAFSLPSTALVIDVNCPVAAEVDFDFFAPVVELKVPAAMFHFWAPTIGGQREADLHGLARDRVNDPHVVNARRGLEATHELLDRHRRLMMGHQHNWAGRKHWRVSRGNQSQAKQNRVHSRTSCEVSEASRPLVRSLRSLP